MKEPYSEGVAHHADLESWGWRRKASAQALTGESAGRVLSREIGFIWGADGVVKHGRQYPHSQHCARLWEPHAVIDLEHAWTLSARNPGDPVVPQTGGCLGRGGKPEGTIHR